MKKLNLKGVLCGAFLIGLMTAFLFCGKKSTDDPNPSPDNIPTEDASVIPDEAKTQTTLNALKSMIDSTILDPTSGGSVPSNPYSVVSGRPFQLNDYKTNGIFKYKNQWKISFPEGWYIITEDNRPQIRHYLSPSKIMDNTGLKQAQVIFSEVTETNVEPSLIWVTLTSFPFNPNEEMRDLLGKSFSILLDDTHQGYHVTLKENRICQIDVSRGICLEAVVQKQNDYFYAILYFLPFREGSYVISGFIPSDRHVQMKRTILAIMESFSIY